MRNKIFALLKWILFPLFDTANQVCMKFLGVETGETKFGAHWLEQVLTSPYWWAAIAADIGSFLMWMLILKKSNLSFATPFIATQYITILIASRILFHEQINAMHLIGIVLIISGLVLVGAGKKD
jgi:drug/metabolite transporter (DMT)-like permease